MAFIGILHPSSGGVSGFDKDVDSCALVDNRGSGHWIYALSAENHVSVPVSV